MNRVLLFRKTRVKFFVLCGAVCGSEVKLDKMMWIMCMAARANDKKGKNDMMMVRASKVNQYFWRDGYQHSKGTKGNMENMVMFFVVFTLWAVCGTFVVFMFVCMHWLLWLCCACIGVFVDCNCCCDFANIRSLSSMIYHNALLLFSSVCMCVRVYMYICMSVGRSVGSFVCICVCVCRAC